MRDRLLYGVIVAGLYGTIGLIVLRSFDGLPLLKAVVATIIVIVSVGLVFGYLVLIKLRKNPEAYNWIDPDLKLTRLKEKEKSKENYYAYDPEQREAIVNDYRESRARREITNKNAWSQSKYNISSATLRKYEREFPKKKK